MTTKKETPQVKAALDAAARYARQYGRTWKSKLADHWGKESLNPPRDRADAPHLRVLRNSPNFALTWLHRKATTKELLSRFPIDDPKVEPMAMCDRPNAIDIHVGRQLARKRQRLKSDAEAFADMLGISIVTLADWEDGKKRIPAAALYTLSQALSVRVSYFFEGLK